MKIGLLNLFLIGSIVSSVMLNGCKKDKKIPYGESGTVTDIDGNVYPTIIIGTQEWMAEDLKVTHYPNGDPIPNVIDNNAWKDLSDNNTDDAYCFYNNNNATDYGALYTYAAAIGDDWDRNNVIDQGVCPDGWHLPSDVEWTTLINYLGGESIAGGKLKETDTTHWKSSNIATNESGFTALPGGGRNGYGDFLYMGISGDWWSSTESDSTQAYNLDLYRGQDVSLDNIPKSIGFSVRCIKN